MSDRTSEQVAWRNGLWVCLGLILYFLLMKWIGAHQITELRILNFVILLAGIAASIRHYIRKEWESPGYFTGFGLGLRTSFSAAISFALFLFIWLSIDQPFMRYLKANAPFGEYLSPMAAAATVTIEGISSGVVITLLLMQYYKRGSE